MFVFLIKIKNKGITKKENKHYKQRVMQTWVSGEAEDVRVQVQ